MTRLHNPWPEVIYRGFSDLDWDAAVTEARRLMRGGASLSEVAAVLDVRARDLDLAMWRSVGRAS